MNPPRIFIGYDEREKEAYEVACSSLIQNASGPVSITPLMLERNEAWGMLTRRWQIRENRMWDVVSEAPQSTEFALSRFLTPLLAQSGWALFTDCDVVFMGDVYELFALADPDKALMVVQHNQLPTENVKMDGQAQLSYGRKNWSSVMLVNADHRAHRRLTLRTLNETPGRDLHAFSWLWDNELGALPREWNWLVGVERKPDEPKIAHFTLGGPWFPNWRGAEHDEIWLEARETLRRMRASEELSTEAHPQAAGRTRA